MTTMHEVAARTRHVVLRCRRLLAILVQLFTILLANRLAFLLRFDGAPPEWAEAAWLQMLPWLIAIRGLVFVPFRLYEGLWRYTSLFDLQTLIGGVSVSSLLFYVLTRSSIGPAVYPRSIFVTDALLLVLLLGGLRFTRRLVAEFHPWRFGRRVLIVGAGDAGELLVRDMKNHRSHYPIGFIDDDRSKVGRRIHGVPVVGARSDLPKVLARHRPDEVLIAIPHVEPAVISAVVRALEPYHIPLKTLPDLHDLLDGSVQVGKMRNVVVEDLLARAPVGLDAGPVKQLIAGRRVLVTGAGGSIGSELCRQIAKHHPASLAMFERYENSLHQIRLELEDRKCGVKLLPIVGDVTDAARVNAALRQCQPEIVFHAAAHKHVTLMEENPCEAIKNNVYGTRILANAADAHGVDCFILISTDKAVNPTSVMGASKRLAELVVQACAEGSGTSFSVVRFGNVLGSNGSVIPRFTEQIRRGGPVTITHPEVRRFFMLIHEAVQLVLHAASQAESGATYVLEMGDQVRLVDMARDLIRLAGLVPDEDITIEYIGLRPGEKLSEELVGPGERLSRSAADKILCVRSARKPEASFLPRIEALAADAFLGRADAVLTTMKELVANFAQPLPDATVREPANVVVAAARTAVREQQCPRCKSWAVRRSRARGPIERLRKDMSVQRLFRCEDCGWRGWLVPMDYGDDPLPLVPLAPNLSMLDAAFRPDQTTARPSFSPRNLH
jgi:FlaA1/EpsC-like NDP-sugar epimerase